MPTRVSIEDKARAFDILSKKLNLSFDFDRLRLDVSSVELGFSGDGKITASYEFIDLKVDILEVGTFTYILKFP